MKTKLLMPTGDTITADMPEFKTPHNHDTRLESQRTAIYFRDPSLTKQEFVEETDINVILERFMKTGQPPPLTLPEHFLDVTNRSTYYDFAQAAAEANHLFYMLPAKQRAEFLNDPTRWADAVVQAVEAGDKDTLRNLGIAVNEKPQEPTSATPAGGGTPAPSSADKASAASKSGGKPPEPSPGPDNPPSDNGK